MENILFHSHPPQLPISVCSCTVLSTEVAFRPLSQIFSDSHSLPLPFGPLCSLWLFSAHSVLNSENLNTEATENHRGAQRNRAATENLCAMQRVRGLVLQSPAGHEEAVGL